MTSALAVAGLVVDRRPAGVDFVLDQPVLRLPVGGTFALVGPSGCGKSTLLDVLALILRPTRIAKFSIRSRAGETLDLTPTLVAGSADRLAHSRSELIGYVLQTGGLLPFITVRANVALPSRILGRQHAERVDAIAARLGLTELLHRFPGEISVGQRQRVAVARALIHDPPLLIADEPTASLDPRTADETMELLVEACRERSASLIVSTHDRDRAVRFGLQPLRFEQANGRTRFVQEAADSTGPAP